MFKFDKETIMSATRVSVEHLSKMFDQTVVRSIEKADPRIEEFYNEHPEEDTPDCRFHRAYLAFASMLKSMFEQGLKDTNCSYDVEIINFIFNKLYDEYEFIKGAEKLSKEKPDEQA